MKKVFLTVLLLLMILSGCASAKEEEIVFLTLPEEEVIEHDVIYLAAGEETVLSSSSEGSGLFNLFTLESGNAVSVKGNTVTGTGNGTARVSNGSDVYVIEVSDLYTAPRIVMEKEFLPCHRYTEEEAAYLDKILAEKVEEAGRKSRAAAVEAARFLTLRLPYSLHYFYENGRIEGSILEADGEGRYYHVGLYLSDDKKEDIAASVTGPEIWGCPLYEYERDQKIDNGLDCSGFISWVLLNAGYDIGDLGSGPSDGIDDLSDLGERKKIEEIAIEEIKAGDLVGLEGHIGIVIGLDGERIYIAEAYWEKDLQVRVYAYEEFLTESEWEYVMKMDSFYRNEGNYSVFWE